MKMKLMALAAAAAVALGAGAASAITVDPGQSLSIQFTGSYTSTAAPGGFLTTGDVLTLAGFAGDPFVTSVAPVGGADAGNVMVGDTTADLTGDTVTIGTGVPTGFSFTIDPGDEAAVFTATSTVFGSNTVLPAALNDNVALEGFGLLNGQSASWRLAISSNAPSGAFTLTVITPPEIVIVPPPAAIPLPAGGALLLSGLGALALYRRKKQGA